MYALHVGDITGFYGGLLRDVDVDGGPRSHQSVGLGTLADDRVRLVLPSRNLTDSSAPQPTLRQSGVCGSHRAAEEVRDAPAFDGKDQTDLFAELYAGARRQRLAQHGAVAHAFRKLIRCAAKAESKSFELIARLVEG